MCTEPVGPMPREAIARVGLEVAGDSAGEVSEEGLMGRVCPWMCKK